MNLPIRIRPYVNLGRTCETNKHKARQKGGKLQREVKAEGHKSKLNVERTGAARLHRAASGGMMGSATFAATRGGLCARDLPR